MKTLTKAGLIALLLGTSAFASNAADLAQKIAKKVQPGWIDRVTYIQNAKAQNNKVIATLIVNDVNNYLTYTFRHKEAVNALKQALQNRLVKQFCIDKHILKALKEGVEYEVDYVQKSNNKVFLKVDVNKNTCKGGAL